MVMEEQAEQGTAGRMVGCDLGSPESGPKQVRLSQYPFSQFGSQNRAFSKNWFEQFKWLEYSVGSNSAFCFSCRVFGKQNTRINKDALSGSGFSNWKRALDTFREHEKSAFHVSTMSCWHGFKNTKKQGDVITQLHAANAADILERREYLQRIAAITTFLGKQGIPFRGHDEQESSLNQGNFLECFKLLKEFDPFLQNYTPSSATTYLSHFSQNEMVTSVSQEVIGHTVKQLHMAKMYSVIADEARDGHTEQLAVCVRFVTGEGKVTESFLGLWKLKGFDAKSITDAIEELLQSHTLGGLLCVAQAYDGASVMSGEVGGVQARFRELHPEAIYVHCYAHQLNLVLCYTCKAVPAASKFFELLENVYTTFSSSLVNHDKFLEIQSKLGLTPSELVQLSTTRWACHLRSIKAVLKNLPVILSCLSTIKTSMSKGILSNLRRPKTMYMLLMFSKLLGITEGLHRYLQGESVDLGKAAQYKMAVLQTLKELRTDNSAEEMFRSSMVLCEEHHIQLPVGPRQKQKRFDDFVVDSACGSTSSMTSADDFKCQLFYPCLDRMLEELTCRFSSVGEEIMSGIQACNPASEIFLSEDSLKNLAGHYKIELRPEEVLVATTFIRRKMETQTIPDTASVFQMLDADMFPTLRAVFQVALTIPVSSCSCERSFSALRRLHTWLRSTMGQERLNDLAIMMIERENVAAISRDCVIDRFAKLKPRRYNLMLPPQN
ncbi:Zinc finger MYM-type protein 1 [Merluccius polli]|uniref:Zinc finger MYM-type protein 1 n=1 Tax=Merluccius polli TaxID=89951 RepID=A0AA47MK62_MERPO|nr:Zinc finger MYM-type protein 1 [Merluccius polli]